MTQPLRDVLTEIETHVGSAGWDQPARLFALASTVELARLEPSLGLTWDDETALTPIEQEPLSAEAPLHESLAHVSWPAEVLGCALVVERVFLPPSAESDLPADDSQVTSAAQAHPDRRDVRIAVAVLRDGTRDCALRFRETPDRISVGADLVPGLADALLATLQD